MFNTKVHLGDVCLCQGEKDKNKGLGQREVGIYGRKDDGEMAECMRGLGSMKTGQKGGRDERIGVV